VIAFALVNNAFSLAKHLINLLKSVFNLQIFMGRLSSGNPNELHSWAALYVPVLDKAIILMVRLNFHQFYSSNEIELKLGASKDEMFIKYSRFIYEWIFFCWLIHICFFIRFDQSDWLTNQSISNGWYLFIG